VYDDSTVAKGIIVSDVAGFVPWRAALTDLLPALAEVFNSNSSISPAAVKNVSWRSKMFFEVYTLWALQGHFPMAL
jgi:hypothetical protein